MTCTTCIPYPCATLTTPDGQRFTSVESHIVHAATGALVMACNADADWRKGSMTLTAEPCGECKAMLDAFEIVWDIRAD